MVAVEKPFARGARLKPAPTRSVYNLHESGLALNADVSLRAGVLPLFTSLAPNPSLTPIL
jgi:hypothetical protein